MDASQTLHQLNPAMSLPDHDVDLEQGQVSERPSDAGTSSPTSGGQQPVERLGSIRRVSVDQDLGPSLPHPVSVGTSRGTIEPEGSVRPTSLALQVHNTEQEDPANTRRQAPSMRQDSSQTPGNTTRSQGVNYGPGEIFGDPSRQMWTLSLSQFEKHDREITDRWKSETDGVLVFTGLFSATVATFVIESYKRLSVDSGDQTVTLLSQMSQQLVGISNGTILPTPPPLSNSPPNLPSAVRVNILWLLSLAISITCALLATLIQQWTRRYMALSYLHDMPHERARVRTFLFTGMEHFRMRQAVEAIPMLLHTSVFLFFAGLVDFFLLFNQTVAWVFIGWIGLFVSVYAAMTIIPNIIFSCPYRTPFTGLFWRLSQMLAVITLVFTGAFATSLDGFLQHSWGLWGRVYRGASTTIAPLLDREKLVKQIATHKHWFSEGLHQRVVSNAIEASSLVDREALIWTLSKLDEDKEVENYISRIPGFFDSRVVPDALRTMLGLMDSPSNGADSVLAVRLGGLLKTCLPTTSGIDPGVDKNRLNICLTAIWCYTKGYKRPDSKGITMSKYFRGLFADENEMNTLLANDDIHTKVMVLCMGSLLVARLMEEMRGQTAGPQVSEGELVFLKKALGPLWRLDLAGHKPTQLTNLDSMLSELEKVTKEHMPAGETLGHEVLDTMNILAEDVVDTISSLPSTEHQGPDLSVLERAQGLLNRCLTLSKQCGADTHLGGLMRSDALDSLAKILEGLHTKLAQHASSHPHPEPSAHLHGPDEGVQLTTHEDGTPHNFLSSAISAAPSMDKEALSSTLAELYEDNEFEAFVARIPTLFDSDASDTSTDNMLDLMVPSSGSESALAPRLHKFFKACLPGKSTLDPDVRKRRLRICLAAIWSYARAYYADPHKRPIPEQFQRLFADPNDMDLLSADEETDTRVMVLSISSLLTTKIVEDIRHRSGNPTASEGELAFLQKALSSFWRPGLPPVTGSPGPTELANLLTMLDGLSKHSHQEMSPPETIGREASETLDILARAVQDSLPEDPPVGPWGSSASVIGHSSEALQQCLSLLKQISEGEDGLVKGTWVDALIGRLSVLDAKLAPPAAPDPPYTRLRTQSNTFGEVPSTINLLVTPTSENNPSSEQYIATMREPELFMGQQYSRVHTPFHYLQHHQG
ncbi:hypothetical protein EDB85DRAFT_2291956 [Lactarius pseudohatsudake]|nr:hypothetical protein EDB85DRAFT_2291956 [Lactarius pseudohatsudake]